MNNINILKIVHVDNFLYKRSMDYLHNKIDIIEHDNMNEIIISLINKNKNVLFITERLEYKNKLNDKLKKLKLNDRCQHCDNIADIINNVNSKLILIGNNDIHKYELRNYNNITNIIIINVNKSEFNYKDKNKLFQSMNKLLKKFSGKDKDNKDIIDKSFEQIQMLLEDKDTSTII